MKDDLVSRQVRRMTLEDAITYYSEMAQKSQWKAQIESNDYMDMKDRAYEAEQLADWLNELKLLRERIDAQPVLVIKSRVHIMPEDAQKIRQNAIRQMKEGVILINSMFDAFVIGGNTDIQIKTS